MRPPISFAEFLKLPKDVQEQLSTFENEYLQEELSPSVKKKKMVELERRLKYHDWFSEFGDMKAFRNGQKEEQEIRKLVDEIGSDGMELYKMYGKKAGVMEALKDPRPSKYEKHLYKKMKEWGIKDLDELEGEAKKRFHAELDADAPDAEESKSIFPEQNVSTKNINLGYAEERPVGGKSNHGFCDPGNLYADQTTWQPPSPQRQKGWENK